MTTTERKILKAETVRKMESYLATGLDGFYQQGWDRMNAMGFDVDLRPEPSKENALAIIWTAKNCE